MENKKILITGSCGFIGAAIAARLARNSKVFGLDNMDPYYDIELKKRRLELLQANKNYSYSLTDIENRDELRRVFNDTKPDIVINLAARAGVRSSIERPREYISTNILGFYNVMELATEFKVEHFIYASSSSVYGANANTPYSESHGAAHQLSPYAATKRANEIFSHQNSSINGLPTTGLRFFTVYGPWGRPDMALFKFVDCIENGKAIDLYNNGNHSRDFTYIDDVVERIELIAKNPPKINNNWDGITANPSQSRAPWDIYNIGSDNPIKLLDFIKIIEKELDKKAIINNKDMQKGDVLETHADMSKFNQKFNNIKKTDLKDGIKKFVEWYKDYKGNLTANIK
jgi:UDP-glucuronate 4-epimerase